MLRILFFIKIAFLYILALVVLQQCGGLSARMDIGKVINETRNIRDAESLFFKQTGKYATLEELEKSHLAEFDLEGIRNLGYIVSLEIEDNNYFLVVKPNSVPDKTSEMLSLYVDKSGIIKASTDPQKIADSESSPIAEQ